jgi:hypothetical protein
MAPADQLFSQSCFSRKRISMDLKCRAIWRKYTAKFVRLTTDGSVTKEHTAMNPCAYVTGHVNYTSFNATVPNSIEFEGKI